MVTGGTGDAEGKQDLDYEASWFGDGVDAGAAVTVGGRDAGHWAALVGLVAGRLRPEQVR